MLSHAYKYIMLSHAYLRHKQVLAALAQVQLTLVPHNTGQQPVVLSGVCDYNLQSGQSVTSSLHRLVCSAGILRYPAIGKSFTILSILHLVSR